MHWAMFYCTVLISSLVSTASPHVISQDEVMLEVRRGEQAPFVVIWNAPTKGCEKCGVDVDVKRYGMKENTDDKWMGAEIALFYAGNLGLYPFYDTDGNAVNGGLPQLGNLTGHFEKASRDLVKAIPSREFSGLGVIDWESWRPLWDRNYDTKSLYKQRSEALVRKIHPDWSDAKVKAEAKRQFESAARQYMEGTLELTRRLRPRGSWGFYGFPSCYNYDGQVNCSANVRRENDELAWLYDASSALYPSAYLSVKTVNPRNDVHGHVAEARRARQVARKPHLPIYLYSTYLLDGITFYPTTDLNVSLGQAANMGITGVVMWGSSAESRTCEECIHIKNYIDSTLGPFVSDVINLAKQCSQSRCSSHGRCINVSVAMVGSDPPDLRSLLMEFVTGIVNFVKSRPPFHCNCYEGWDGNRCDHRQRGTDRSWMQYFWDTLLVVPGFTQLRAYFE